MAFTSVSFKQSVAQLSQATTHSWQARMQALYCVGVMGSAADVAFGSAVAKAMVKVKRVRLMRFIRVWIFLFMRTTTSSAEARRTLVTQSRIYYGVNACL